MRKGLNVVVKSGQYKGLRGKYLAKAYVRFGRGGGATRALIKCDQGQEIWVDIKTLSKNYDDFKRLPNPANETMIFEGDYKVITLPVEASACY